jgi:hypothetical protein
MAQATTMAGSTSGDGSGDRLQQAAGDIVDRAGETVGNRVDDEMSGQLQRAGDVLGSVAQAIRQTGEQLRTQQPEVAGVAETAASQIERFAGHVRESRPRDLLGDVEQFARQQPAVFLGGALLLGALTARLLKASPQAGNGMREGYGGSGTAYGSGDDGYGHGYASAGLSRSATGMAGDGGF